MRNPADEARDIENGIGVVGAVLLLPVPDIDIYK